MKKSVAMIVASSLALGGCTTLKVNKFSEQETSRQGIAYFLPFTQFETKLTWTASCNAANSNEFKLTPKAAMTPKTGPDPDGLYVIDYQSLDAFTKTSNVKVEFYDNGAIKAINASADDKTGEILSTTLTAVGKFAKIAAFGNAGVRNTPEFVCQQPLIDAIQAVKEAKSGKKDVNGNLVEEGVDQKTAKLKAATDRLEAYSAVIVRAGASITDAQKAEHFRRISAVSAAQIELDGAKKKLVAAQSKITFTKTIKFPSRSSIFESSNGAKISTAVLAKWIVNDAARFCASNDQQCVQAGQKPKFEDRLAALAADNSLWLKLEANSDFAGKFTGTDSGNAENGVRYRISVPATLKVCSAVKCSNMAAAAPAAAAAIPGDQVTPTKGKLIKAFPVQMMNQGTTFFLPFKSQAFTNATLSATFAQNGVLTSAGYEQKRAAGEAVAGVAGTLLEQVGGIIEKSRENNKSELDLIKEQTELAKAEKELADAQAALVEKEVDPNDEAIAALATETALLEAEVANINAAVAKIEANRRLAEAGQPD